MKKLILMIVFVNVYLMIAQNIEPNKLEFYFPHYLNQQEHVPFSADNFPQNNFIIGWWWGHDLRSADNLNTNMAQTIVGLNYGYSPYTDMGTVDILNHPTYKHKNNKINIVPGFSCFPAYAESFQYEPTLKIDPDDTTKFIPLLNPEETAHSIFGFKDIHPDNSWLTVENQTENNIMKYRLKMVHNDACTTGVLILSKPWMNDQFTRFIQRKKIKNDDPDGVMEITEAHKKDPLNDVGILKPYYNMLYSNSIGWFVSINLRILEDNIPTGDEKVLQIKIPYFKTRNIRWDANQDGYITFSEVPFELNPLPEVVINPQGAEYFKDDNNVNGRGGFYYYIPDGTDNNTTININGKFLKRILDKIKTDEPNATLKDRDITISAYFKCSYDGDPNPLPRGEANDNDNPNGNTDFQRLGLDVTYWGHCGLSIDWLRIGTPQSLAVYQGRNDENYKWYIQRLIDFVHDKPGDCMDGTENISKYRKSMNGDPAAMMNDNYELFRIYGGWGWDGSNIWNWGMYRYLNQLFPNMLVQALGPELVNQYDWYVNSKNRWAIMPALKYGYSTPAYYPASSISDYEPDVSRTNHGFSSRAGLRGDPGYWNGTYKIDRFTFNSGYETFLLFPKLYSPTDIYFCNVNPFPNESIIKMIREERPITNYPLDFDQTKNYSAEEFYNYIFGGGFDGHQTPSFQARWENGCYTGIYGTFFKNGADKLLYNGRNWWGQIFISNGWTLEKDKDYNLVAAAFRPNTGEEINLMCFTAIVLGSKGLVYDRMGGEKIDKEASTRFPGPCYSNYIFDYNDNNTKMDQDYRYFAKDKPGFEKTGTPAKYQEDFEYLKKEELGRDFLANDDLSNIQSFLMPNCSTTTQIDNAISNWANYLGVKPERIYLGAKSTRFALRKIHDFAMENSDILMKLRLVSWHAKGFRTWISQHPNPNLNSNLIKDFIKVPDKMDNLEENIPLKVRPIGREKDGKPYFEPPDSTFYDVTLLAETGTDFDLDDNGTPNIKSMDKVFYIGVLNRRTDPLILNGYGPDEALHGFGVDFYSSAEFDDYVVNGGIDIEGNHHDAPWWQERWWKRLGCREITIPLNIKSGTPNDYKLVKVTELSRNDFKEFKDANGDYLLSNSVLDILFPKVNTIIGQDGTFTTKYLPGEGKIFKCEVINQPATFTGSLAHSNQSKLVAYPNASGDIQYHLVYHKQVTIGNNTQVKVFYKRSVPINHSDNLSTNPYDINTENIKWQNPPEGVCISDRFSANQMSVVNCNCDYPSIVVRPCSSSINAYIIYSCAGDNYNSKNRIVVSMFDIATPLNDPYFLNYVTSQQIDEYEGLDRSEWGNPVVNASTLGNFYAWSTKKSFLSPYSESAIVLAYATPDIIPVRPLNGFDRIAASEFSGGNLSNNIMTEMKHPSLNVYSDIANGENECSLVWQQNSFSNCTTNLFGETDIYYTRLTTTTNFQNVIKYFPPKMFQFQNTFLERGGINPPLSIAKIKNLGNDSYPVVYHSLKNYIGTQNSFRFSVRYDLIYAQNNTYLNLGLNNPQSIFGAHIYLIDFCDVPFAKVELDGTKTYLQPEFSFDSFFQPNISQPSALADNMLWTVDDHGEIVKTSGDAQLNFTFKYDNSSEIFQISPFANSLFVKDNDLNVYYHSIRNVDEGEQPHLASSKKENRTDNMWQNRRVYNQGVAPNIVTSAKYFYRNSGDELIQENYVGYGNLNNRMFLSLPKLNEKILSLKLPFYPKTDTNNRVFYLPNFSDTISTEWFTVDNTAILNFKLSGTGIVCPIVIQRRDSNLIYPVTLPPTLNDSSETLVNYTFINGQGHDYRLVMLKVDSTMGYNEKIMITDSIPIQGILPMGVKENIIDLTQGTYSSQNENGIKLSIYPNPADNTISIKAIVPESVFTDCISTVKHIDLGMKIYSNIGEEIKSCRIKPGEVIKVNTSGYSQGVYFVKAVDDRQIIDCLPIQSVLQGFVIKR